MTTEEFNQPAEFVTGDSHIICPEEDEPIISHWARWGHLPQTVMQALKNVSRQYLPQEHRECVDAITWLAAQPWCSGRVGMTGISWGGYLTSLVCGLDSRLKFAIPVYGCGHLGLESAWVEQFEKMAWG